MGTIRPNNDLSKYANEGLGDYTIDGTENELIDILEVLGKAPEMQGELTMDVTLDAVNGNPFGGDNSETVTVTLSMQVFQPSGMNPVTT